MRPKRILDLDAPLKPERVGTTVEIVISIPNRPGTEIAVFQHYIVCSLCDAVMKRDVDAHYYEAKEIKKLAPRLCIGQDEASQIAVAFCDDGESYCEMFSFWATAGMNALNTLSTRLPLLLRDVGVERVCVRGSSTREFDSTYLAILGLFPNASIDDSRTAGSIVIHHIYPPQES